jgi:hypothetical protein
MAIPIDETIYTKARELADAKYKKHSAYKSGYIQKVYKEMGGRYVDDGSNPLARWFKEKWMDVGGKDYPVYRPTKRVSKATPLTIKEIDPANLAKQVALKQVIKGEANLPPFVGGNIDKTKDVSQINNATGDLINSFAVKGKVRMIGSNSLRAIQYGSDYDIESIIKDISPVKIANMIQKEYEKAGKSDDIWITDFKAGHDPRMVYNGDYSDASLKHYFSSRGDLLSKAKQKKILALKGEDRIDAVRDLYILRWKPADIKRGKIKMPCGGERTLEESLLDKTTTKIDLLKKVGNQFAEVSENYYIRVGDRSNFVNTPNKSETEASLEDDIHYYSKVDSFKALKRLFSLLQIESKTKNKAKLERLVEFFNSQVGYLNKIKNELGILQVLLEQTFRRPKWADIEANLQFIKEQISTVYKIPLDEKIFKTIDAIKESNALSTIKTLKDYFATKINQNSKDFLRSII